MFGWLFGKKKKKKKQPEVPDRLYEWRDLASEFFAMWPGDQLIVLRTLGVPNPQLTLDYARPDPGVEVTADNKRETQPPMSPAVFLRELRHYVNAGKRIRMVAVFQQIFRDLNEAEEYATYFENNDDE